MKTKTVGGAVVLLLVIALTIALASPVQAEATTVTTNDRFDMSMPVLIPCTGEIVHLEGTLHVLSHITIDGNEGFHIKYHANPQGITGVTTSGRYKGAGVTQGTITFHANGGMTHTYVNNFRLIGQGSAENYMIHVNTHMTINPDGTITSSHDNIRITCK